MAFVCSDRTVCRGGSGLFIMADLGVACWRHAADCRPGLWYVFVHGMYDLLGRRVHADCVVDDFGSLVAVKERP